MTCDGAANFDWSAIPSALVPADTTFLALGMASGEELVLNLNKAIVNPANAEPAALLSLTIESAQGLPAGVTAEYPTNPLLAMSQSCVPLTGVPTEEGLFELVLSCNAQVFAGSELEVVEDVVFSHWIQVGQGTGIEDQSLNAPAITLFPNPAADRLTLGVPANTCLERAEVFNLSGQRVHEEAFSEEQGSQSVDVSALPQGAYVMVVHFSTTRALRSSWSSGDSKFLLLCFS